ncbi:MAG TPA: primosomal protein N' [Polyangiales bacterium]|nr:primosomal protein N' [Polyangiales bacterium]
MIDAQPRFVEVCMPLPVRQSFTYSMPPELGDARAGVRVAVPFGRQKLQAYVLGSAPAPDGEFKVRPVAAVLDHEPIFSDELLGFLRAAADYYLHPLGEVLRSAAPALASDKLRALRDDGFLEAGESLRGRRVATQRMLFARALISAMPEVRLGENQRRALARLLSVPELALNDLRGEVKQPRAVLRALEAKGFIVTEEREVSADRFFASTVARDHVPTPTADQSRAIEALSARLGQGGGFLLHGVTGSGKTEVYLRLIAEARARGLGALMLVPEIALTPQLVSRFRARFGDELAVLHSELGERERHQAWRSLRDGQVSLAIGARSALFAPVPRLGVVIVDEEHDGSFKQEEGFRYQARDMALLRAHRAQAVCVLGSATPSLESYRLSQTGKLGLLSMPERATAQSLPPIEIVDLERHRRGPTGSQYLSAPLFAELETCLEKGEQAILFLNRRGFAPAMQCSMCAELLRCPACSVSLTQHRRERSLRCHYCDFSTPMEGACPACHSRSFRELGLGTERLESELREAFPEARVARLDRDTAAADGVSALLDRLRRGEIDVLVGTQMVTKGHDLPGVTLVGVILADQSMGFPDFRAFERTFQLLTQVAGRAGRGSRPGRVIFQTYQPHHYALQHARTHDYLGFCQAELAARRELGYPPFSRLIAVRIDAGSETETRRRAQELAALARECPEVQAGTVALLGPAPAPIERLRGRYRYRFLLRSRERAALRAVAKVLVARIDQGLAPARASLDVDPVSML